MNLINEKIKFVNHSQRSLIFEKHKKPTLNLKATPRVHISKHNTKNTTSNNTNSNHNQTKNQKNDINAITTNNTNNTNSEPYEQQC